MSVFFAQWHTLHRTARRAKTRCVAATFFTLFALNFLPFAARNANAASLAITGGGAKIYVDFVNPQAGKVLIVGSVPQVAGLNTKGLTVTVSLAGFTRSFVLDGQGQAMQNGDLFELNDNGTVLRFALNAMDANLLSTFAPQGITATTVSNQPLTMDATIAFAGNTYTQTLNGGYYAIARKSGYGFLGIIKPPAKDPFKPVVKITTLKASPNPTTVNQTVTIKGNVSLKDLQGPIEGRLNFGDMSQPMRVEGNALAAALKTGVQHQYQTNGIFTVRISFVGANEVAATRLYVIIGPGYDVNSTSGAYTHLMRPSGSGVVQLELGVDNVPGASNAMTTFKDLKGNPAGNPAGETRFPQAVGTPQMGLSVFTQFTLPGIYISETTILDAANQPAGTLRKQIVISAANIGGSLVAEEADEAAPNAEKLPKDDDADDVITLTAVTGRFRFTSTKQDKVNFTGTVALPAGFNPKNALGNDIQLAMGNVVDQVHLNEKGKFSLPTANSVVTRFRLTPPHLPTGVAIGGEIAKVNIYMYVGDLDIQGFDSEGVTASIRSDEVGQTSVERFVQVAMLISGKSYSALIPVQFAVTTNEAFGSIVGR